MPLGAGYVATKHGVVGLSTSLRAEGAGLGVKVSVVCPGAIRTGIFDAIVHVTGGGRDLVERLVRSGSKMMVSPDDCARVILRGVERNKAIIVVMGPAHVLWWLNRLNPNVLSRLFSKMLASFRSSRVES